MVKSLSKRSLPALTIPSGLLASDKTKKEEELSKVQKQLSHRDELLNKEKKRASQVRSSHQ
jgi:hypothetical protein